VIKLNLKSYPHYKDSGISWIGEIPGHWRTNKLKTYFFIVNGSTPKDFEENWGGDICWITPADYKTSDVYINSSSRHITKKGLNSCGTTIVPAGSIIVSNRAPIGTVAIANKELCTNQGCKSLTVKRDINTKFVYYILSINEEELNKLGRGTTFMELSSQDLGTFGIPIATLVEQEHIVKFLDKKTTKIEENIAKNQELIKLLEEKRTALINQVVTKGLNPDVPMKDSGVEWIGEIPEHWVVINLKKCCEKITDGSHFSPETTSEGKYYITVRNVLDDKIDFKNASKISLEDYKALKNNGCEPKKGDVLLSKDGTIGKCIIVNETNFVILSSLGLLRPNHLINSKYLRYYLLSDINIKQMLSNIRGSAIKRLTINIIKELLLILPSCDEQKAINNYLDPKVDKINNTIKNVQKNINLLEEYKTSLIHHVVTGKIDVRGEEI